MTQTDIGSEWKEFFDRIGKEHVSNEEKSDNEKIIFQYMTMFQQTAKNDLRAQIQKLNVDKKSAEKKIDKLSKEQENARRELDQLKKSQKNANKEIDAIRHSLSYRIGRCITFVPRKIRGYMRRFQRH